MYALNLIIYMPNSKNMFSTPKLCSHLQQNVLNSKNTVLIIMHACVECRKPKRAPAPPYMCFEFVLLSNMSGNDLRRTLGDAINRIARISNDELGPILAVNPENQREAQSDGAPGLQAEMRSLFPTLNCAIARSFSVPRGTERQRQFSSGGRTRKRRSNSTPARSNVLKRKPIKAVHRDLVLIPDPDETSVPTHASRLDLEAIPSTVWPREVVQALSLASGTRRRRA